MSCPRATSIVLVASGVSAAGAVAFVPYAEPLFFHMAAARQFLDSGRIPEYLAIWAVLRLRARRRWHCDSGLVAVAILPLYGVPFVLTTRSRVIAGRWTSCASSNR